MDGTRRIVQYLKSKAGMGFSFPAHKNFQFIAYCDFDWETCKVNRCSDFWYCVNIGDALVSWKAKKLGTVSRSSVEAENKSLCEYCSWVDIDSWHFENLGVMDLKPTFVYCDNEAALHKAANPVYHETMSPNLPWACTKHIEVDCNFIQDKIQDGTIEPNICVMSNNLLR